MALSFAIDDTLIEKHAFFAYGGRMWSRNATFAFGWSILCTCVVAIFANCATPAKIYQSPEEKLRAIRIPDEKLTGTPKELVAQLNALSKKYDFPAHTGVKIRFSPEVDDEPCWSSIFSEAKPLKVWLQQVCDICGSRYEIDKDVILIKLLPLSEKRTEDFETSLPAELLTLCREFREKRNKGGMALGEKLFTALPHSPIAFQNGSYVSYDTERPAYQLYKQDVLTLLGPPDRNVNNESFYYSLGRWELGVNFGKHDYVENPNLHGH